MIMPRLQTFRTHASSMLLPGREQSGVRSTSRRRYSVIGKMQACYPCSACWSAALGRSHGPAVAFLSLAACSSWVQANVAP